MADTNTPIGTLPSIANTIPQVRAPTSRVTGEDIAQPQRLMAQNLARAGEVLEKDVAIPFAREAGEQAVRAGPDGQPIIDPAPIFGPASQVYQQAAKETAWSTLGPRIETDLHRISKQFEGNPEGYGIAAKNYTTELVSKLQPDLRMPARAKAIQFSEHNIRTLGDQADKTNLAQFTATQQASIARTLDRMISLSYQGGAETKEFQDARAELLQSYANLSSDPRTAAHFPPARVEQEIAENIGEVTGQGIVGEIVRKYKTRANSADAQRELQERFLGPGSENLPISHQKREKFIAEGLKHLERISNDNKLEVTAFRQEVTAYDTRHKDAPANFDLTVHNSMEQRAFELGDIQSLSKLTALKTMIPLLQVMKTGTPAEQTSAYLDLSRRITPNLPVRLANPQIQAIVEEEAKRLGFDPQRAVRIARLESAGDPNAITPSGTFKGLFQLSGGPKGTFGEGGGTGNIFDPRENTRAALTRLIPQIEAFERKKGGPATDTEVYLIHQQGAAGLPAHLANPDAPAWQNIRQFYGSEEVAKKAIWDNLGKADRAKFGSVENVTSKEFLAVWDRKVRGAAYGDTGFVAGAPLQAGANPYLGVMIETTIKEMGETVKRNANTSHGMIKKQLQDNVQPTAASVATFINDAMATGQEHLIKDLEPSIRALDESQKYLNKPALLPVVEGMVEAAKSAPGGIDPTAYRVLNEFEKIVKDNVKQWGDDPYGAATAAGTITSVNPIQVGNPDQALREIEDRQQKGRQIHANVPGLPSFGIITAKPERVAIKEALTQGDVQSAAALLSNMERVLDPEVFKATMHTPEMKQALVDMTHSSDPARMMAGFKAIDRLYKLDPAGTHREFNGDFERLQAWQGLRWSAAPEDLVVRLNSPNDPSRMKALADVRETAKKEAEGFSANDIAYGMGSAWGITNLLPGSTFFQRHITGSTPIAPLSVYGFGPVAEEMQKDFVEIYSGLRQYGLQAGTFTDRITGSENNAKVQAFKRLQTKWSISPVGGNQIMANPPDLVQVNAKGEREGVHYPLINGSHDWIKNDIQARVAAIPPKVFGLRWMYKGLLSDAQTEREIRDKQPPSYRIIIDAGDGLNQVYVDPQTGQDRFAFRPGPEIMETAERIRQMTTDIFRGLDRRTLPQPSEGGQ